MRTVSEIIEAVKDQRSATDEELRLALLCVYHHAQLCPKPSVEDFEKEPIGLRLLVKEAYERWFRVLRAEPDKYLGDGNTPGTAENNERRRLAKSVLAVFERRKKGET